MTNLIDNVGNAAQAALQREPGVVELFELAGCDTAVIRVSTTIDGLKTEIADALHEIELLCRRAGVGVSGPPFVRYLDWAEGHLVAEIGMPVARPMPATGRVEPSQLPGGRVASVIHLGPYETIPATYQLMTARLEELGLHATGPMWEIYWTDPERFVQPETWRTEIVYPVA
ncbi:MAG TPA: GyrI-like domain-containing protein [Candidatus Limnocylindrales bacterium]|nr:GyrI-like domain-containing protein [Candidatus Limnocylindrales bacterium]